MVKKVHIKVGMTCGGCKNAITKLLTKAGVEDGNLEIDLEANFAQHHYAQVKEQQHNNGGNNNNSLNDPDLH